jgi:hypothetical protein
MVELRQEDRISAFAEEPKADSFPAVRAKRTATDDREPEFGLAMAPENSQFPAAGLIDT